jgi:hypothetical protein
MNLLSAQLAECQTPPKLDTDQQVLKNTIKHYWDARAMIA